MNFRHLLFWLALLFTSAAAQASISCTSIASNPNTISTNYVNGSTAALQSSFTVTCNRSSTTDPTSLSYSVTATNGLQPNGANNNALLVSGGTSYTLRYDVYLPAGCGGGQWKGNGTINGTVSWSSTSVTGTSTDTQTYWFCINTTQTLTGSGFYTDTVGLTATWSSAAPVQSGTVSGSIGVSVFAPASCTVTQPANLSMTYPAFSTLPVSSSSTFYATCSNLMTYSLAVSPTSGTLAGVNYTVGVDTPTSTGTGGAQMHSVTATAVPGQAGTCPTATCTPAAVTHTLTVTY
jgi:hypothetical protein